jgi:hypothetical protein
MGLKKTRVWRREEADLPNKAEPPSWSATVDAASSGRCLPSSSCLCQLEPQYPRSMLHQSLRDNPPRPYSVTIRTSRARGGEHPAKGGQDENRVLVRRQAAPPHPPGGRVDVTSFVVPPHHEAAQHQSLNVIYCAVGPLCSTLRFVSMVAPRRCPLDFMSTKSPPIAETSGRPAHRLWG